MANLECSVRTHSTDTDGVFTLIDSGDVLDPQKIFAGRAVDTESGIFCCCQGPLGDDVFSS